MIKVKPPDGISRPAAQPVLGGIFALLFSSRVVDDPVPTFPESSSTYRGFFFFASFLPFFHDGIVSEGEIYP
jgi:hypothetical protein